jgi:hypothetical protein
LGLKKEITIKEFVDLQPPLNNSTLKRLDTDISIPTNESTVDPVTGQCTGPLFPLLSEPVTIELHRDASTIRVFKQLDSVPVLYSPSACEVSWPPFTPELSVPSCSDTAFYPGAAANPSVPGPSSTFPVCVSKRIGVKRGMVGTTDPDIGVQWTLDDVGDWVLLIKVLQNGRTSW